MAVPLLIALRDNALNSLLLMGTARGFQLDYRTAISGGQATWEAEKDFERPTVFFRWDRPLPGDARTGVQDAASGSAGRQRHYERFLVSVAIKAVDGDVERRAWLARADIERALILTSSTITSAALPGGLNRNRGNARSTTFEEPEVEWQPIIEGGVIVGGLLGVYYVIRWDHLAGDMGTG